MHQIPGYHHRTRVSAERLYTQGKGYMGQMHSMVSQGTCATMAVAITLACLVHVRYKWHKKQAPTLIMTRLLFEASHWASGSKLASAFAFLASGCCASPCGCPCPGGMPCIIPVCVCVGVCVCWCGCVCASTCICVCTYLHTCIFVRVHRAAHVLVCRCQTLSTWLVCMCKHDVGRLSPFPFPRTTLHSR